MPDSPSLRILVVLPMYGGSLPIGRYCAEALRDLGHAVRVFEAPLFFSAFTGIRNLGLPPAAASQVENGFLQNVGQAIWAQAESLEPHLVLALAQAPMNRTLIQRLRRAGVRTVMWFVEDHEVFDYWRHYAPLYDAFAVIQKEPFLGMLRDVGQPNGFYLPMAALPSFHRPLDLTPEERRTYGASIGFLGAGYPNRRLAFRALAGRDFKIWGSDWDGETVLARCIQRSGERIEAEESVKIYNATDVNLNLHSSLKTDRLVSGGDFVNPRTFELAAMGAFQITDRRALLPELFEEDEIVSFSDMDEFLRLLSLYSRDADARRTCAEKARARVLRDHTYQQRMRVLLERMAEFCGPWPEDASRAGTAADDLPESIRADLPALLADLGLGPNAPFADVVDALRSRSGTLSELETAILFLDEWRKQYLRR